MSEKNKQASDRDMTVGVLAFVIVCVLPILFLTVYNYLGPGLLTGLWGSGPSGAQLITGNTLVVIIYPIVTLALFGVFVYNFAKLWREQLSVGRRGFVVVEFLITVTTVAVICFWKIITG